MPQIGTSNNLPPDSHKQMKLVRGLVWGSVAVLVLCLVGGTVFLCLSVNQVQSDEYTATDFGRTVIQAAGLAGDPRKIQENQNSYAHGGALVLQGIAIEKSDPIKAEEYYRQALYTLEKYPGLNNSYAVMCLQQLSENLDKRGKYKEEETTLKSLVECEEKAFNKRHRVVSRTLDELGDLYYSRLGRFDLAWQAYSREYDIDCRGAGKNSVAVARDLGQLGATEVERKNYQQALLDYKQELEIAQRLNDSSMQGYAADGVAYVFYQQKQYPDAVQYWRLALEHIDERDTLSRRCFLSSWLSHALIKQGKADQAAEILAPCAQLLMDEPAPRAAERREMVTTLLYAQDPQTAGKLSQDWLSKAESKYGEASPSILDALYWMSECARSQKLPKEQEACYKRMFAIVDAEVHKNPSFLHSPAYWRLGFSLTPVLELYSHLLNSQQRSAEAQQVKTRYQPLLENVDAPSSAKGRK